MEGGFPNWRGIQKALNGIKVKLIECIWRRKKSFGLWGSFIEVMRTLHIGDLDE